MNSLKVFYSYSHRDRKYRDTLETHLSLLEREGLIASWHDRKISAGSEWKGEIDKHLEEASIILLLISADFLASDYCYDIEMGRALQRHDAGEARVIPLIIRPVAWQSAPFARLQVLPEEGKPVISWHIQDEAWRDIAEGIRLAVREIITGRPRQTLRRRIILRAKALPVEIYCVFATEADIGRSPECDFSLTQAPHSVSNFHARLFYQESKRQFLIQDMDSRNGVYVNDRRIENRAVIELGATVSLSRALRFIFRVHDSGRKNMGTLIYYDDLGRPLAYYIVAPSGELRLGNGIADVATFPGVAPGVSIGRIIAKRDGCYFFRDGLPQIVDSGERLYDGSNVAMGPVTVRVDTKP